MTKEKLAAIQARAEQEGWDQHTTWLVILGEMEPDEVAERARVREGAKALHGRPISHWPKIEVRWDLSVEARHHALDGMKASDFAGCYSQGDWVLLCVPLDELKVAFCSAARRTPDEVWKIGDPSKAARALFRWSEGKRMTPPMFGIWQGKEVTVTGGNHRVAIADAVGVRRIPAYLAQEDLRDFLRLVPGATQIPDAVIGDPKTWDTICCDTTKE